ncbi:MAG: hypothetical protein ACOYN0_14800, partial [Phycisphaerales bacterium]
AVPADHCMVQVDAGHGSAMTVVGHLDPGTGPALHDAEGQSYRPVGWVYTDDAIQDIRYTRDQPIASLNELTRAGLKTSDERSDQSLRLLLLVPNGVEIERFTIGDQTLCVFDPRPIAWAAPSTPLPHRKAATPEPSASATRQPVRVDGLLISTLLPSLLGLADTPGFVLSEDNRILRGRARIANPTATVCPGIERELRIQRFAAPADHCLIQIDASQSTAMCVAGYFDVGLSPAPELRDAEGRRHPLVGWVYRDLDFCDIRYTPDQPIVSLDELALGGVRLYTNRFDQSLRLLFLVPQGVELDRFTIGDQALCGFEPRPRAEEPAREPLHLTSEAAPSAPPP